MLLAVFAGALLVYCILLGGTEAGVFLPTFQIANAVIGATVIAWWVVTIRRGSDLPDLLVVSGLIAFLISCIASQYPRQSLDAALGALTWTAVFGIGRRLLSDERNRLLCLQLLALCGLLLALLFALLWGSVWVEWIRLMGGVPPFDLTLPAELYRHYYVVAMLLVALAPASVFMLGHRYMRYPAALTIFLSAVLTVLSGSRIVWLALAVGVVTGIALLRPSRRAAMAACVAIAAGSVIVVSSGVGDSAFQRLIAGGTVGYRLDIWREAIEIWLQYPVFGTGPGTMPIALTTTDLTSVYEFTNRHADNALLQLAAEGGLAALTGAVLIGLTLFVGRHMGLVGARAALVGIVMLAVLSLANNPTDSANLAAIGVVYGAMLAPFRPPDRRPSAGGPRRSAVTALTAAAAVLIAVANVAVGSASIAQAMARDAVAGGDRSRAIDLMEFAVAADPSMALYHREHGVLLMDEDLGAARLELERTLQLNAADAAAARALALANAADGDAEGAVASAKRATDLRPLSPESWMTLAMVSAGDESSRALARALRLAPWLPGSPVWPSILPAGEELDGIREMAGVGGWEEASRDPVGHAWLAATTDGLPPIDTPSSRGLRDVLMCAPGNAQTEYQGLRDDWIQSTSGIVGRIMLARLTADPMIDELIRVAALKRPDLGKSASGALGPFSLFVDLAEDQQLYRRVGLGPVVGGPIVPRPLDALGVWMDDPSAAAARSEPKSPLATCP
jgi:O-antigen ligase